MSRRQFFPENDDWCQLPYYEVGDFVHAHELNGLSVQWPVADYEIPAIWDRGIGGDGVCVVIVDTGRDMIHATSGELMNQVVGTFDGTGQGVDDHHGHGTLCASVVAGIRNGLGNVGVAPGAKIVAAKGLGNNGSGSSRWIVDAINGGCEKAKSLGFKAVILSLSLGGPSPMAPIEQALKKWHDGHGILCVAAAGNGSGDGVDYPGQYAITCGVGAVDQQRQLASFSDRGRTVDIVAPGVEILGAITNGQYARWSGTSFSCPWIAGVLALRLSRELKDHGKVRTNNINKLRKLLDNAAVDLGPEGKDPGFGRGVLDVAKFVGMKDAPPPPPSPPPPPGGKRFRIKGTNVEVEESALEQI